MDSDNVMKSKRRMKRNVKIILILVIGIIMIITVSLVFCGKNKKIALNNLTSGLYTYKINDNYSIQNTSVRDNKIYYLIDDNGKYKYYSLDIYTNKVVEKATFNDDMCLLNNYYLSCNKGQTTKVYDTNLKEIYQSDEQFTIIPYKDSFLVIKDKEIYLNDKKIRTIKDDIEGFNLINYYVSSDNTYIYFISSNESFIYNVSEDTYEKFNYEDMYLYDNGIYYANKDTIYVKDLKNNKSKEYKNFRNTDDFSLSVLKDNLLMFIDNNYLKIYNLDTNKFKVLDYQFVNAVDKIILENNYLYIINPQEIYIANISEIDSKEYTIDEFTKMQKNKIDMRIEKIESKYNTVEIIYDTKDIDDYDKWEEKLINEDRNELILEALEAIDSVLDKFGKEFLSVFKHDDYKGLRIIISKKIVSNEDSSVKNISGFTFPSYTYYNVIISEDDRKDIMPYEKIFCHEMMHAIDYHAIDYRYDIAGNWYDYNPKEFSYNVKHYLNEDNNYTSYDYDKDNVYFVDSYSKVNQSEDRARIFENVCYIDNDNIVNQYPNLLKKAKYIRDELIKYYPSIKDAKVFDGIK